MVGFPGLFPGVIAFLADLTPAPHFMAREMILPDMFRESLDYLKAHIANYECIITDDLAEPESRAFRDAHTPARIVTRSIGGEPYYILLKP